MVGYKTYYMASVENSSVGDNSIIGDFSRVRNSEIGKYVRIDRNNLVQNCKIGDYSYTGPFDMVFNTEIGKYTSISYGVTIGPPEHDYKRISMHPFIYNKGYDILDDDDLIRNDKFDRTSKIGNDVWIGCNCTILRGVEIPNGVVVGANSVVTKTPKPYSIIAGCPARVLKMRFDDSIIHIMQEIRWWDCDAKILKKCKDFFVKPNITFEDCLKFQTIISDNKEK